MAEINSLIEIIADGIINDSELHAWSVIYYDTQPAVFENCDPRNDPVRGDCPLVVVVPDSKSVGLSTPVKGHVVQISCLVYDDTTETTLAGVVRFLAGRRSEEMRVLTLAAVCAALPDGISLADVDTVYMPLDEYPLAATVMRLTLTEENLIGLNPYE